MSQVTLYMAMSVDGFITGPGDGPDNPAGDGGMRLMEWLSPGDGSDTSSYRPTHPQSQVVYDESMSTGAVITGRRTGDFAGYWGGDHHDGVPIFVPTHRAPTDNPYERVHYVTDGIESCVAQAKAAAGDRDVMLHGAYTAQACLKAGLLDVLEIQLMPVLLGQGRRLFEHMPADHVELELTREIAAPGVLHLRYQVHTKD
jgi:dihydrofolate reductase